MIKTPNDTPIELDIAKVLLRESTPKDSLNLARNMVDLYGRNKGRKSTENKEIWGRVCNVICGSYPDLLKEDQSNN